MNPTNINQSTLIELLPCSSQVFDSNDNKPVTEKIDSIRDKSLNNYPSSVEWEKGHDGLDYPIFTPYQEKK